MGYSFLTEKFNKKWVRCTFIQPNGQFLFKTCKYSDDGRIKEGKCSYLVDQDLIHYEGNTPYLMYFSDNPIPISFMHEAHEFNGRVITSEVFNEFCESKVIGEVLKLGATETLLLILLGVVILLVLGDIAVSSGILNRAAANATANMTANMTIIH